MDEVERTKLTLSKELVDRVEGRLGGTDFDSSSEYIEYVVDTVLHQVEAETTTRKENEDIVNNRLHDLGYLE